MQPGRHGCGAVLLALPPVEADDRPRGHVFHLERERRHPIEVHAEHGDPRRVHERIAPGVVEQVLEIPHTRFDHDVRARYLKRRVFES